MQSPDTRAAAALMEELAERTGVVAADGKERRYLWTDAFAVCNFLGLAHACTDERYTRLALRLVERVHHVLGRHRADDRRRGWISGLGEDEGARHPTQSGLRIGKPLPEREPAEPLDEAREWDRDGQYFHYLTKWMHALDQVTRATGDPVFNLWARELAARAHAVFTYPVGGGARRMYWKMSIDGSRPLVASTGHHDPLDGYVTYAQLQATASSLPPPVTGPSLGAATADFARMLADAELATGDPLGIGGLLADACRVAQLTRQGAFADARLLERLLAAALVGLRHWAQQGNLAAPATRRLAFRELGLAIGLRGVELIARVRDGAAAAPARGGDLDALVAALLRAAPLAAELVAFWGEPARRRDPTWSEHRDINDAMLATALAPEGFLVLRPPPGAADRHA